MRLNPTITTLALFLAIAPNVEAATMTFTDRAAFDAAIAGFDQRTLDFESESAGRIIADGETLSDVGFHYPELAGLGIQLAVTDGAAFSGGSPFSTTSGSNFLGTDDGDLLQDGDDIELRFQPANALGLYFITADLPGLIADDVRLTAGTVSMSLDPSAPALMLADGSIALFLGLLDSSQTFSSARLSTGHDAATGAFFFNVDDLVIATAPVPLPGAFWLMGLGLAVLGFGRGKRSA